MTKIFIAILFIGFSSIILPQELSKVELDSLYNLFTYVKGVSASENIQQKLEEHPEIRKCGLGLVASIKENLNNYSIEQQNVLSKILSRPSNLPDEVVTSNGFYRVHYTTTGVDAIGYNLNQLLSALDSAYNFEINYLGFLPPPSDGSEGGDDKYDIYVQNLGGLYGYTQFETKVADSRWTSYIVINNDFSWYTSAIPPKPTIDAARVTVAHEFHHAIQSGNYAPQNSASPFRSADLFFYELTSTSFEEFVFDGVNDYYAYMHSYFQHPENAMPNNDGYNLAIWNIYLQKRFSFDLLKQQWEMIPTNTALKAIALSISNEGSTLGNELNKFGTWCYFTNSRTVSERYFDEAANYPLITPTAIVNFNTTFQTYNMSVNPAANYYLKINLPTPDGEFNTIVTNSDWQKAIDNPYQFLDFSYSIYHDSTSGEKAVNDFYSVTFDKDDQLFWNNVGILNNIVVYGDSSYNISNLEGETFAYPVPYKTSTSVNIRMAFQTELNPGDDVDLSIFSSGGELYFSGKKNNQVSYIKNGLKYGEVILEKDDANFSSGVYIYVIKSGNDIYKGKLVIFND